jgi:hypothetical protein
MNAATVLYLVITFTVRHFLFEGTELMKQQQLKGTSFCVFSDTGIKVEGRMQICCSSHLKTF